MSHKAGRIGMMWGAVMLIAWPLQAQDTDTASPEADAAPTDAEEPAPRQDTAAPPEAAPVAEAASEEPAPLEPASEPAPAPEPAPIPPTTGSGVAGSDAMVQTVPVTPAPPPPGYEQMTLPPRPRKGLMIAGWGVFGGVYLVTALAGLMLLDGEATDSGEECTNCDDVGPRMLIPLVGPFMAIPDADGADGRAVCAVLGVLQIAGLTMGIVGTLIYAKKKRAYREALSNSAVPRFDLAYDGRAGGAFLSWAF